MTYDFSDQAYYPGSKERRQAAPRDTGHDVEEDLLGTGTLMLLGGAEVEFFTIGQLAAAIGRKPVTLRKWEADGVIPTSGYVKPSKSKDPRGRRRLYSRAQCEGILRIAYEEGIMAADKKASVQGFATKVRALFDELKAQ